LFTCTRSGGLAETILQGTVTGKEGQGLRNKKWADNIQEWTGKDFALTLCHVPPEMETANPENINDAPRTSVSEVR